MEYEKSLDQLKDMIASDSLKPDTYSLTLSLLQCNFLRKKRVHFWIKKGWENGNSNEALALHAKIAASDWEQNKEWLKTMKRVLLRKWVRNSWFKILKSFKTSKKNEHKKKNY